MKRLTIIFSLLLIGCQAEEPQPTQTIDCNCNRVTTHTSFNGIGYSFGEYTTINDCSGEQVSGNWNTNWGDVEPTNGECY